MQKQNYFNNENISQEYICTSFTELFSKVYMNRKSVHPIPYIEWITTDLGWVFRGQCNEKRI